MFSFLFRKLVSEPVYRHEDKTRGQKKIQKHVKYLVQRKVKMPTAVHLVCTRYLKMKFIKNILSFSHFKIAIIRYTK